MSSPSFQFSPHESPSCRLFLILSVTSRLLNFNRFSFYSSTRRQWWWWQWRRQPWWHFVNAAQLVENWHWVFHVRLSNGPVFCFCKPWYRVWNSNINIKQYNNFHPIHPPYSPSIYGVYFKLYVIHTFVLRRNLDLLGRRLGGSSEGEMIDHGGGGGEHRDDQDDTSKIPNHWWRRCWLSVWW